jgi:hypothetical protein
MRRRARPARQNAQTDRNRDLRIAFVFHGIMTGARRDLLRTMEAHGSLSLAVAELSVHIHRCQATQFLGRVAYFLTEGGVDIGSDSDDGIDSSISVRDLDMDSD